MGLPEASEHLFQPRLRKLTDSIYILLLLKKVPHQKNIIYCQQNFIFLPHFLLYLLLLNPAEWGKKGGSMGRSQS